MISLQIKELIEKGSSKEAMIILAEAIEELQDDFDKIKCAANKLDGHECEIDKWDFNRLESRVDDLERRK